jgi:alginate O-acetyltransferase complex protein AlgI
MLFNSLDYFLFLMLAVAGYWTLVRFNLLRVVFLWAASCLFYMAWNPAYIVLILFSTVLDYAVGLAIFAAPEQRVKKRWLWVSLCGNLGLLGTFKYYNFFASAVHDTLGLTGVSVELPYLDVLLPVGISFYTFQTMSYTIDLYRGKIKPTRNFFKFAFYITFFPQLVAGPIVRAVQFLPQLDLKPTLTKEKVGEGLFLIATGIVKKVAIADFLAVNLVDRVFDNPEAFTAVEVLLGLYGYTAQIYCDFSGYTDVARGSAMLLGFRVPENFNRPYQATSPADFWRRWHITLSSWLRDYLYFPLGGSRGGPVRAYWNLWLTMFLIGLWHGADWTFVLYGIVHATAMVLHRFFYRRSGRTRDTVDPLHIHILKIIGTVHFSVFSRILFRGTTVENAWDVTTQLFAGTSSVAQVSAGVWIVLVASYALHYLPRWVYENLMQSYIRLPAVAQGLLLAGLGAGLMQVVSEGVVPYIYFQF